MIVKNALDLKVTPSMTHVRNKVTLICGDCNAPTYLHPLVANGEDLIIECDRELDDFPRSADHNRPDYYDAPHTFFLHDDYTGPEANVLRLLSRSGEYVGNQYLDEAEYVSADIELRALDAWHDKAPNVCTLTLEQHQAVRTWARPDVSEALITDKGLVPNTDTADYVESRNAYVEGNDGFLSIKVLDEWLTRKYHARLLNVFRDKQDNVRIGSITLLTNLDGTVTAKCVKCKAAMHAHHTNITREQMEDFVLAIIRHGNNHAAKWLVERPTWYKAHTANCDLSCDKSSVVCNDNASRPTPTDESLVDFLFEHQRYCSDANCKCAEVLSELVPALV